MVVFFCLFVCLFASLLACLFVCLFVCLFFLTSVAISVVCLTSAFLFEFTGSSNYSFDCVGLFVFHNNTAKINLRTVFIGKLHCTTILPTYHLLLHCCAKCKDFP